MMVMNCLQVLANHSFADAVIISEKFQALSYWQAGQSASVIYLSRGYYLQLNGITKRYFE